ncbi:hypothetical protein [Parendozoicomonas haliclonae]|uniref:Cupin domain protein n=1 Tax=Parendozoicomonas haliclonae TaxID=1960125 RepID=A0A1X7AQX4_9GAMM|nr:hypothetical protein [Parendozoicomonas haliclonae]SMA50706.1 hypothetical protein EHSB41UT_04523 [Parendozoicomonas haliclonae]
MNSIQTIDLPFELALSALPNIVDRKGVAHTEFMTLSTPEISTVSKGVPDAVAIGPVWSEQGVNVFQGIVKPGGSMTCHSGETPLLILIRAGIGVFENVDAGQENKVVEELICKTGTLVLVNPGVMHGFRNAGETELAFLGIQPAS